MGPIYTTHMSSMDVDALSIISTNLTLTDVVDSIIPKLAAIPGTFTR
jgi:hypothetical protein